MMIRLLTTLMLLFALVFALGTAQADDADCSMCHDSPPIPDTHPAVSNTTPGYCFSCHVPATGDALFSSLHSTHIEMGMSCDSCHGDADLDALRSSLQDLIPAPLP